MDLRIFTEPQQGANYDTLLRSPRPPKSFPSYLPVELIALGDRDQDMIRAVTYERQSHKSETDSQASPKMQRDKSVAYIKSQDNWAHVEADYADVGLSGYDPNVVRPGFERLMADARAKKFDVVVIYMLSRLTRQGAAEALRIQQELAKHGVALVSTQEPFINTSDDNPFGVAFFALIAGLAHQESKNKSKFIRDAFAELNAKGSHSSGPVPFGFVADQVNVDGLTIRVLSPGPQSEVAVPGPESTPADTVNCIIEMAEDGKGTSAIASDLTEKGARTPYGSLDEDAAKARVTAARKTRKGGASDEASSEWSPTVVGRILRDPRLAGYAIGPVDPKTKVRTILRDDNGQPVSPHTGFISPKRWYDIQRMLDGRKRTVQRDRTGERTLLGSWGLLRCKLCDSGMTVARAKGPYGSYVCNMRRTVADQPKHATGVTMPHADDVVASRVWARLGALDVSDPDDIEWLALAAERFAVQGTDPQATEELAEQEAQLLHVQASMEALYADRAEGLYDGSVGTKSFKDTIQKYQTHEKSCTDRIAELTASATSSSRLPVDEWFSNSEGDPFADNGAWTQWGVDERRSFLALFVDAVTVAPSTTKAGTDRERVDRRIAIAWV
ncbi:recombinase family protein [Streptomyces sp. NBC_00536]|uniref:recombinase family protein n=1 Tax=Streptomyces sp. NBC_00536 TaxID=2975769 RepID=UPI002E820978|nr:recombinase family protein [Streptomyces sp. NBC_00536]WUC81876.1 recombinase family protein [Streptomyces sp. NBC_00536]